MADKKSYKEKILEEVTTQLLEILEKGENPWHKPWNLLKVNQLFPEKFAYNFESKKPYQGINQFTLRPGFYLTFKQVNNLKGKIKKGSHSHVIVYNKVDIIEATEEEISKIKELYPEETLEKNDKYYIIGKNVFIYHLTKGYLKIKKMLKKSNVFYEEDIEGVDFGEYESYKDYMERLNNDEDAKKIIIEEADKVFNDYKMRVNLSFSEEGNDAYYSPTFHKVVIPPKILFENSNEYYSTLYHELCHSTGHKDLLNRQGVTSMSATFGSADYSKEELVAEIGASYSLGLLNISTEGTIHNSAAYLKSWANAFKKDKSLSLKIMEATKDAEKAVNLIFDIKKEDRQKVMTD